MADLKEHATMFANAPPTDLWSSLSPTWESIKALDGGLYQAGTICDLAALTMMLVAGGSERLVDLYGKVATNEKFADDATGDHWHYCKSTDEDLNRFATIMKQWAAREDDGAVQLKFCASGDWHTFMIERLKVDDVGTRFRVYQGYEGYYRLRDFLGLAADTSEYKKILEATAVKGIPILETAKQSTKSAKLKEREDWVKNSLDCFNDCVGRIGKFTELTKENLLAYIVVPFETALKGQIESKDYAKVTAHLNFGERPKKVKFSEILMLMFDTTVPGEFEANALRVNQKHANLTSFCGMPGDKAHHDEEKHPDGPLND